MNETATATLVGDIEPLTALDRCDACASSAAKVRVTLTSGGELLFCGHDANKHLPVLLAKSLVLALRDEREFAVN